MFECGSFGMKSDTKNTLVQSIGCKDAELTRLRSENEQLRARLAASRDVIKSFPEWVTNRHGWTSCPLCLRGSTVAHRENCPRVKYNQIVIEEAGLIPAAQAQPTETNESEGQHEAG